MAVQLGSGAGTLFSDQESGLPGRILAELQSDFRPGTTTCARCSGVSAARRSSCPQPPRRALPGLAASRASTPGPGPMYAQASGIDSVRQYATHTTRLTRHDTTRHDTTTILQWHHGIRFIHKYIVIPWVWGCQNPNRVTCFSGGHCGLEDSSRCCRFGAAHSSTTVHSTISRGGSSSTSPVPDPKPSP